MTQPTRTTPRLVLRPFTLADAPRVQQLAGAREIADVTANVPHPYEDGMAERWISTHQPSFAAGTSVTFAITLRADHVLCGAIGLIIRPEHRHGSLGYWLGVPYWNHGYCTEATQAIIAYGFGELQLHRIYASHLTRNPASGRVMQKAGMQYEGCFREHFLKNGRFEDVAYYGLVNEA